MQPSPLVLLFLDLPNCTLNSAVPVLFFQSSLPPQTMNVGVAAPPRAPSLVPRSKQPHSFDATDYGLNGGQRVTVVALVGCSSERSFLALGG